VSNVSVRVIQPTFNAIKVTLHLPRTDLLMSLIDRQNM
jgi:hypothetical protein